MKNTYFNTIFAISALVFHVSMQAMKIDDTSMIDNVTITQEGTYDEHGNLIEDTNRKIIDKIDDRLKSLGKFPSSENIVRYYEANKDRIDIDDMAFSNKMGQRGLVDPRHHH